jgi:hypothetical protein
VRSDEVLRKVWPTNNPYPGQCLNLGQRDFETQLLQNLSDFFRAIFASLGLDRHGTIKAGSR